MKAFRFFPPSSEEQRAFFAQMLGAILCLAIFGVLAWRTSESGLRAALVGGALGVLFLLARSAWRLEKKAARAQHGEIVIEENGFSTTDEKRQTQFVAWEKIEQTEVRGGRLFIAWRDEKNTEYELQFGAREIENGMELIQLIASRGASTPAAEKGFEPPSNFIALSPK